ncbi:MAG: glycosyltransferase family 2 protein [Pseudomonadota bacterium]
MSEQLELSVVIPVFNEAGNVEALLSEIKAALDGRAYEIIFVDDESTDETHGRLVELVPETPELRVLRHRNRCGQSRAVRTGVMAAKGRVIATLDGDGQNVPVDLPDLYRQLTRSNAPEKLAMVIGERVNRQESPWRNVGSRFGNVIRRAVLHDGNRDSACGIKVIHRNVFLELPYFDHMHRYMPALVQAEGYEVETRPVQHRRRRAGKTKYTNIRRLIDGWSDLRAVAWLIRRRRHPGSVEEVRRATSDPRHQAVSDAA